MIRQYLQDPPSLFQLNNDQPPCLSAVGGVSFWLRAVIVRSSRSSGKFISVMFLLCLLVLQVRPLCGLRMDEGSSLSLGQAGVLHKVEGWNSHNAAGEEKNLQDVSQGGSEDENLAKDPTNMVEFLNSIGLKEIVSTMSPLFSGKMLPFALLSLLPLLKPGMDGEVIASLNKHYSLDDVKELLALVPPFTAGKNLEELSNGYRLDDVKELLPLLKPGMDGEVIASLNKHYSLDDVKELLALVPPFTAGKNLEELSNGYRLDDVKELLPLLKPGMDGEVIASLNKHYSLDDVKELLALVPPFTAGKNLEELSNGYRLDDVKELLPLLGRCQGAFASLEARHGCHVVVSFWPKGVMHWRCTLHFAGDKRLLRSMSRECGQWCLDVFRTMVIKKVFPSETL
eukprot:Skav219198  [mRNA]  locus=scaffold2780:37830:39023:- [translate_table: standard]